MPPPNSAMRAIQLENIGKPRALKDRRVPLPQIAADEALVRVHATSVNAADLLYRSGALIIRKPLPHILGGDLAGDIIELGADAGDWKIGDRVAACFAGLGSEINGSYAEYCALPVDRLVRLPETLDYEAAAGCGASFADAFTALASRGHISNDDRVVIHDAESSLGIAAVQIAKAKGALVIAISHSEYTADLRAIGADITLDAAGSDLARQVKVATDELGATIVLRSASLDDLAPSMDMLAFHGKLIIAAATKGPHLRLNVADLLEKNLSLYGVRDSIATSDYAAILESAAAGIYQPVVDDIMPLSQARAAHIKMERRPPFGKILLKPDAIIEAAKKPPNWIPIE